MYRLFCRNTISALELLRINAGRNWYIRKCLKPLSSMERQQSVEIASNDISLSMPQTESMVKSPVNHTESIGILDPVSVDNAVKEKSVDIRDPFTKEVTKDKSPLPFEEIPGPAILKLWEKYWKYVPLLGRLHWNRNVTPLKYFFNQYGPVVRINGPFMSDIVMLHRPEHIAEVFKQEGCVPFRSGLDILQHYHLHHRKYRLPGPFSMKSLEWIQMKEKMDTPINETLTQYVTQLETICEDVVCRIRRIRNRQDEVPRNFNEELSRWGMENFFVLMFNKRLGFLDSSLMNTSSEPTRMIVALLQARTYLSRCETGFQVWRFFETPFRKKLFAACDVIDGVIGKYIQKVQQKLHMKPAARDSEQGFIDDDHFSLLQRLLVNEKIHPDDISSVLLDMILLGVEATTNSEAFLLYFLAKSPRVQRKLYAEIHALNPDKRESFSQEHLRNMPYLRACIQECLRLRAPFPYITRVLTKTITLHGYTIPKDTYLIMANDITSKREENFEDPEKFYPERWLNNKNEESAIHEFSSLPFGHGLRWCLGKNMALMEMMIFTAKVIQEFRIEYDYADIGSDFYIINVPNKPLRFRFIDRN